MAGAWENEMSTGRDGASLGEVERNMFVGHQVQPTQRTRLQKGGRRHKPMRVRIFEIGLQTIRVAGRSQFPTH